MPLATVTNCVTTEPVIHMHSTTGQVSAWSTRHTFMSVADVTIFASDIILCSHWMI